MHISLIVAAALNNAIGKNNQMLWHLPRDFKFFKNKTWGLPVIMGRKTFESLGKPLGGRINIVISKQPNFQIPNAYTVNSLNDALALAANFAYKEAMIIGGGQIYAEALPLAHTLYLTRVDALFEDADTYFPSFNQNNQWQLQFEESFTKDEKHAYNFQFQTWVKNQ